MRGVLALAVVLLPITGFAQTPQEQVLQLVNSERWANGQLPPLKGQAQLDAAANSHSQAMGQRNFFAHCDLDTGVSPWTRMANAGYTPFDAGAENIAAGYAGAQATMQQWMTSAGHRANILSTSVREIGIGYYLDSADTDNVRLDQDGNCQVDGVFNRLHHYWTQNFGRRDAVMPVVIAREAYQVSVCNSDVYLYGSGWASEYRLSNDGATWSPWQPFAANVLWNLVGAAGGTATVHAQIRNGGQVRSAQDSVRLAVPCAGQSDLIFQNGFQSP